MLDSLKTGRIVRGHDAESSLLYTSDAGAKPNVASDGQLYERETSEDEIEGGSQPESEIFRRAMIGVETSPVGVRG